MGLLGRCFTNWRSTLNKKIYVQKGKNARDDSGKIPVDIWKEFKQQKNMEEAVALGEENYVKAMKAAENPHHLGTGGYSGKIAEWRREEEEREKAGLPDIFVGLDGHSWNWVLARTPTVIPWDKVACKKPSTELVKAQMRSLLKPDREKY